MGRASGLDVYAVESRQTPLQPQQPKRLRSFAPRACKGFTELLAEGSGHTETLDHFSLHLEEAILCVESLVEYRSIGL